MIDQLGPHPRWGGSTAAQMSPRLLQPIVDCGRRVFEARAASILIWSPDDGDLVFGAVSGEGEDSLVGHRIAADTGVAGWVMHSQEPARFDTLDGSAFDRRTAEATGYVPTRLMAAPLLAGDDCVGVLEILDWGRLSVGAGESLSLLQSFANQAGAALHMIAETDSERRQTEDDDVWQTVVMLRHRLMDLDPGARASKCRDLQHLISLV